MFDLLCLIYTMLILYEQNCLIGVTVYIFVVAARNPNALRWLDSRRTNYLLLKHIVATLLTILPVLKPSIELCQFIFLISLDLYNLALDTG